MLGLRPDAPDKLEEKPPLSFSVTGCSSPLPGCCMVPRTGSHSQPVEGDNELLRSVSVNTVACPCNACGCVQCGFGGIIGEVTVGD